MELLERPQPQGLGGWLAVHILAMAASAIALDYELAIRRIPAIVVYTYQQGWWLLFAWRMTLLALIVGYPVACTYCAFMYKRIARWLLLIYFGLWTAVMVAVLIQHKSTGPGVVLVEVLLTALCLAGVAYFWVSKRVRNTFVH